MLSRHAYLWCALLDMVQSSLKICTGHKSIFCPHVYSQHDSWDYMQRLQHNHIFCTEVWAFSAFYDHKKFLKVKNYLSTFELTIPVILKSNYQLNDGKYFKHLTKNNFSKIWNEKSSCCSVPWKKLHIRWKICIWFEIVQVLTVN